VAKQVQDGDTRTQVSQLRDTRARQAELAELAGGDQGDASSYAASLLKRAG
jgi:DNA repair protein RecN (Recombination protein N)